MLKIDRIWKKIAKIGDKIIKITFIVFIINFCFPQLGYAAETGPEMPLVLLPHEAGRAEFIKAVGDSSQLPVIKERGPKHVIKVTVTAYNSLPGQTDGSPCITASGMNVCEHNIEDVIATNYRWLPFGTKVRFPELFGDKFFTVQDRMNKRYSARADIWMKDYSAAKKFGKKYLVMEVY